MSGEETFASGHRKMTNPFEKCARLQARVAELEAAVKFYADKMSWVSDSPIATPARRDQGQIARAALQRDRRPV